MPVLHGQLLSIRMSGRSTIVWLPSPRSLTSRHFPDVPVELSAASLAEEEVVAIMARLK